MRRIVIEDFEIAIVTKNNSITRVLTGGKYWLSTRETFQKFNMYQEFQLTASIDQLMLHEEFKHAVDEFIVPEGHIALQYEDDILKRVFNTGKYYFWKRANRYRFEIYNTQEVTIPNNISKNILTKSILVPYIRTYKVEAFEQAVLFIDGVYKGILQAGNYYWFVNPISIVLAKVDMRQTIMELNGQEILTKDKAQLRINCSIQYRVIDIEKALITHKEHEKLLYNLLQLNLRSFIGQMTLDELMEQKNHIDAYIMEQCAAPAANLGITLVTCGLKDIILPGDVKEIMNQVLIAEKKAQANMIMRREETAATRSLMNTAKLMEENTALMRLKEMEYLEKIADKVHSISLSNNGQVLDQLKQLFIK